jgi:hypothetical protein
MQPALRLRRDPSEAPAAGLPRDRCQVDAAGLPEAAGDFELP